VIGRLAIASALALGLGVAPPPDGDSTGGDDRLQFTRVTSIVQSAHAWLISQQNADGSFSVVRHEASSSAPIAVTSLSALSFMAAGNLPDRGRYDTAVRRAVNWLVDRCNKDGYFTTDNDTISRMHGQGYALLALTQAYGMGREDGERRKRMHAAIERAIALIERTQGETGGWFYNPVKMAAHEGSITVCMLQALRAARDIGFTVDTAVIDKARRYMAKSQDAKTGRFRYAVNDPKTSWALTAAALSTLNAMGDYGSDELKSGFDAMQRSDPFTAGIGYVAFQDYGALYAAQAYWQYQDQRPFERWWPAFVAIAEKNQRPDGDFYNGDYGNVYATAVVTLTLQVPFGYLPIFQR
jgi:hypothetical protein